MTQLRHWLCTAAMVLMPVTASIKVLVLGVRMLRPELRGEHAAAGFSRCFGWRGGVAPCGAGAAGRPDAADRRSNSRSGKRYAHANVTNGVRAGTNTNGAKD